MRVAVRVAVVVRVEVKDGVVVAVGVLVGVGVKERVGVSVIVGVKVIVGVLVLQPVIKVVTALEVTGPGPLEQVMAAELTMLFPQAPAVPHQLTAEELPQVVFTFQVIKPPDWLPLFPAPTKKTLEGTLSVTTGAVAPTVLKTKRFAKPTGPALDWNPKLPARAGTLAPV